MELNKQPETQSNIFVSVNNMNQVVGVEGTETGQVFFI